MPDSCPGRVEALSALLDGELEREEELELRRHLERCERCAAWRAELEGLSGALARELRRERAPRRLGERVARLAPRRVSPLRGPERPRAALALGAGVLLAAGLAAAWALHPRPSFEAALVADHRKLVSGRVALDAAASDPRTVERVLAARLPFSVELGTVPGAKLLGGHACHLAGRDAAYLQFERGGERVSVFAFPRAEMRRVGGPRCRLVGGASLCEWDAPGHTVAVVSSDPSAVASFESAVRAMELR